MRLGKRKRRAPPQSCGGFGGNTDSNSECKNDFSQAKTRKKPIIPCRGGGRREGIFLFHLRERNEVDSNRLKMAREGGERLITTAMGPFLIGGTTSVYPREGREKFLETE